MAPMHRLLYALANPSSGMYDSGKWHFVSMDVEMLGAQLTHAICLFVASSTNISDC